LNELKSDCKGALFLLGPCSIFELSWLLLAAAASAIMSRKPAGASESMGLIYQMGRCIDGEYYIIAVYDDPSAYTIMFSAYELENDATYTYPLTYNEFDNLFRFDSELMNPSNQDGRFTWVIDRLDFIMNDENEKMLCLAQEPTMDDENLFEEETTTKKGDGVAPPQTGRIDAATRAKLLKELDTQDDNKLHNNLVRTEKARKEFLADLHHKRHLEQLKATQRLVKADEEREARLAKLDLIRSQQEKKALAAKAEEEAKKSTMAQLEVLMKQKQAQNIRRLIQEKDEADRGMGREKDAARQKRKMQERSANEIKKIENEKAHATARKRADYVAKWEKKVAKKSRAECEKVREWRAQERAEAARLREAKDKIIHDLWKTKAEKWLEGEKKRNEHEKKEADRDMKEKGREMLRAKQERTRWEEDREKAKRELEEKLERRKNITIEMLRQAKVDAMHRATAKRDQQRRDALRDKKIEKIEETRMRKFREKQYLEQAKAAQTATFDMGNEEGNEAGDDVGTDAGNSTLGTTMQDTRTKAEKKEQKEFQRTFEQEQRAERRRERAERVKKEEEKHRQMDKLGAKDPMAREIARIQGWFREDEEKKQMLEQAKLDKELALERAEKEKNEKDRLRIETFEEKEKVRRARSQEREKIRIEGCLARVRDAPIGAALPKNILAF